MPEPTKKKSLVENAELKDLRVAKIQQTPEGSFLSLDVPGSLVERGVVKYKQVPESSDVLPYNVHHQHAEARNVMPLGTEETPKFLGNEIEIEPRSATFPNNYEYTTTSVKGKPVAPMARRVLTAALTYLADSMDVYKLGFKGKQETSGGDPHPDNRLFNGVTKPVPGVLKNTKPQSDGINLSLAAMVAHTERTVTRQSRVVVAFHADIPAPIGLLSALIFQIQQPLIVKVFAGPRATGRIDSIRGHLAHHDGPNVKLTTVSMFLDGDRPDYIIYGRHMHFSNQMSPNLEQCKRMLGPNGRILGAYPDIFMIRENATKEGQLPLQTSDILPDAEGNPSMRTLIDEKEYTDPHFNPVNGDVNYRVYDLSNKEMAWAPKSANSFFEPFFPTRRHQLVMKEGAPFRVVEIMPEVEPWPQIEPDGGFNLENMEETARPYQFDNRMVNAPIALATFELKYVNPDCYYADKVDGNSVLAVTTGGYTYLRVSGKVIKNYRVKVPNSSDRKVWSMWEELSPGVLVFLEITAIEEGSTAFKKPKQLPMTWEARQSLYPGYFTRWKKLFRQEEGRFYPNIQLPLKGHPEGIVIAFGKGLFPSYRLGMSASASHHQCGANRWIKETPTLDLMAEDGTVNEYDETGAVTRVRPDRAVGNDPVRIHHWQHRASLPELFFTLMGYGRSQKAELLSTTAIQPPVKRLNPWTGEKSNKPIATITSFLQMVDMAFKGDLGVRAINDFAEVMVNELDAQGEAEVPPSYDD
jgi:hypothetical protein